MISDPAAGEPRDEQRIDAGGRSPTRAPVTGSTPLGGTGIGAPAEPGCSNLRSRDGAFDVERNADDVPGSVEARSTVVSVLPRLRSRIARGAYPRPEPLGEQHCLGEFDCGEPALDEWLKRHAHAAQASGSARVFVVTLEDGETVVGYYALAAAQVAPEEATARALEGQT